MQIAKDQLLFESGQVSGIQWQFASEVTGRIGPSGPLAAVLEKAGIPWCCRHDQLGQLRDLQPGRHRSDEHASSVGRAPRLRPMAEKPARIEMLRQLLKTNGELSNTDDGILRLNEWFLANVEPDPDQPGRVLPEWYSVVNDVALSLGEVIIERCPGLRWEFFTGGKKDASYQRHVIMGFSHVPNPKFNVDIDRNAAPTRIASSPAAARSRPTASRPFAAWRSTSMLRQLATEIVRSRTTHFGDGSRPPSRRRDAAQLMPPARVRRRVLATSRSMTLRSTPLVVGEFGDDGEAVAEDVLAGVERPSGLVSTSR